MFHLWLLNIRQFQKLDERLHQRRHIVGLRLNAFVIIGPARGEIFVADFLPVDRELIDTVRGGIEARAFHFLAELYLVAQQRARCRRIGRRGGVRTFAAVCGWRTSLACLLGALAATPGSVAMLAHA